MRAWIAIALVGCGGSGVPIHEAQMSGGTFGDDVAFLRAHLPEVVILSSGEARVAIAPAYQGRVMTSSARGEGGASFGWIHRELIASGEHRPHMNAFGGEDRFWLGPEGGQYALYFPPGAPFDLEHWQVPAAIDTDAWEIAERSENRVSFRRAIDLGNRAGTRFSIGVEREVRLLEDGELGALASLPHVAYQSINSITNTGNQAWDPQSGLVSIWILSMYRPSPRAIVVIPFRREGSGAIVNDRYFGAVPRDRLLVDEQRGVVFFRADGDRRGKIGIPFARAAPVLGSWDPERGALTLVRFTLPDQVAHGYVNSLWEEQREPFGGDVANSYNDGPPEPGVAPLGPFYELESSSPAAALAPGERLEHRHTTIHLEGSRDALDAIARAELGVGLDSIETSLTGNP